MLRILLVAGLVLLAGCAAPVAEPVEVAEAEPAVVVDPDRPATTFERIELANVAGPDLNATLEAAPRLIPGEWWRIRYTSPLAEGGEVEYVRVVAEVYDGGYVIGMPHEGWFKEAIAFHAPAFGDVNEDLSYNTHNVRFEPVRFPLVQGATWETAFATTPLVATVESTDEYTATIVLRAPEGESDPVQDVIWSFFPVGGETRVTYDARVHEISKFETDFGSYEVVEHGYGFEGWVTVPRGEHTAIDYGQFGPATPGEVPVGRTLDVSGGFNRMTLMHVVIGITPGAYKVRSVAPDGSEFVTEKVGSGFDIRFYEATNPDGTWAVEDVVVGAGATYSMGIAYHQYDIRLPDGAKRSDHSHPVIR